MPPNKKAPPTKLVELTDKQISVVDPPRQIWISVSQAIQLLWADNPKLHDMGNVVESIKRHGFQELPKFDINLQNVSGGVGAIKAGNGRIEGLNWMEKQADDVLRGVGVIKDTGGWAIPIITGTDAESAAAAEAYAIDSNNLTMMGGDFVGIDFMRMWDEDAYIRMLEKLGDDGALPVSVDGDDLDFLQQYRDMNPLDYTTDENEEPVIPDSSFVVEIHTYDMDSYEAAIIAARQLVDDNPSWKAKLSV